MSEHTKLPEMAVVTGEYHDFLDFGSPCYIVETDEEHIAFCYSKTHAHFIVRACNSHEDLLAACTRLLGAMGCDELNCGRVFDDDLRKEVKDFAKAAIEKAASK